jgi:hypothetical protein
MTDADFAHCTDDYVETYGRVWTSTEKQCWMKGANHAINALVPLYIRQYMEQDLEAKLWREFKRRYGYTCNRCSKNKMGLRTNKLLCTRCLEKLNPNNKTHA